MPPDLPTANAPSTNPPPLVLASRSPRRRELLTEAGIPHDVQPAPFDDADMPLFHHSPIAQAMALAYIKAKAVESTLPAGPDLPAGTGLPTTILGADTLCIVDGQPVGKPRSPADARRILTAQVGREHRVVSGVALITPTDRWIAADVATVSWGEIPPAEIESYIDSGLWKSKAGGYNLFERIDAGWPITYEGDPTTIMGLPMNLLTDQLTDHLAAADPV